MAISVCYSVRRTAVHARRPNLMFQNGTSSSRTPCGWVHYPAAAGTLPYNTGVLCRAAPLPVFNAALRQLSRAALSIAANFAEGNERLTKPDRKHFFGIGRGSVQKCVSLLELAAREGRQA